MNRGCVKIKGSGDQEFVVEAKMVDGNLWLTKLEMADLFNTLN